jgi:hypothetical protein
VKKWNIFLRRNLARLISKIFEINLLTYPKLQRNDVGAGDYRRICANSEWIQDYLGFWDVPKRKLKRGRDMPEIAGIKLSASQDPW